MKINIIQFKITLNEVKPPVWRRVQVQDNIDFTDFHLVIQEAMGWQDVYLFGFDLGEFYITIGPEEDSWETVLRPNVDLWSMTRQKIDEYNKKYREYKSREKLFISDFINKEKQNIKYTYNFKYEWNHTIFVEKIFTPEEGKHYPVCLSGKRACPPDMINWELRGAANYMNYCKIFSNPDNPNNQNFKEEYKLLLGEEFDLECFKKVYKKSYKRDFEPEYFNLDEINQKLQILYLESIHGKIT